MFTALFMPPVGACCLGVWETGAPFHMQPQNPSLVIQPLPSNSARFGYARKGEPPGPSHACLLKQRLLYCLHFFSSGLFHLPVSVTVFLSSLYNIVSNALRTVARDQSDFTHSWSLSIKRCCFRQTGAWRTKQCPSCSVNVRRIHPNLK